MVRIRVISCIVLFLLFSIFTFSGCKSQSSPKNETGSYPLGPVPTNAQSSVDSTGEETVKVNAATSRKSTTGLKTVEIGPANIQFDIPANLNLTYSDYDITIYSNSDNTVFLTVNPLISKYGYFGDFGNKSELLNIVEIEKSNIAYFNGENKFCSQTSSFIGSLPETQISMSSVVLGWQYDLSFSKTMVCASSILLFPQDDNYYMFSYNVIKGHETDKDKDILYQIVQSCQFLDKEAYSFENMNTLTYTSNTVSFKYPYFLTISSSFSFDRLTPNPEALDMTSPFSGLRIGIISNVYEYTDTKDQEGILNFAQKMCGSILFESTSKNDLSYGLSIKNNRMHLIGGPVEVKTSSKSLIRQDFGLSLYLDDNLKNQVYGNGGASLNGTLLQYMNNNEVTLIFIFLPTTNEALKDEVIQYLQKNIYFI